MIVKNVADFAQLLVSPLILEAAAAIVVVSTVQVSVLSAEYCYLFEDCSRQVSASQLAVVIEIVSMPGVVEE